MLRVLRRAGFSIEGAGHAYALLDSFIYGFALQEAGLPVGTPDSDPEVMQTMARSFSPADLPYLAETAMYRASPATPSEANSPSVLGSSWTGSKHS